MTKEELLKKLRDIEEKEKIEKEDMIEINGKKWSKSTIYEALKHYAE